MPNDEITPELELDDNETPEDESTDDSVDDSDTLEDETDYKAEFLKQKAINKRISERNKASVKTEDTESMHSISQKDLYALSQANVNIDDFDEVIEYAKFKNITVMEVLNNDVMKTTLANKSAFRKTAEASNTGSTKKGSSKVSDSTLEENLSKGIIPEKGSDEAERLFYLRRGGKR